jgi:hypothetical protein
MEMPSRVEAERRLRERADADPAFRADLIADPKAAIESEFGVPVPDGVNVQVHEESLSELHLVLPVSSDDLSDAELEAVSGGGIYDPCSDDSGFG